MMCQGMGSNSERKLCGAWCLVPGAWCLVCYLTVARCVVSSANRLARALATQGAWP